MARFGMPAELAYSEEFDVETEVLGSGLGDAFNCWVLVLVIKKGEWNRSTDVFTLCIACCKSNIWIGANRRFRYCCGGMARTHAGAYTACESECLGSTGVAEAEEIHSIYSPY
jgi:hypothetical protein